MVSLYQPFVNVGIFVAAVVSDAFSDNLSKISYQAQLCILYAIPVWLFFSIWFVPESPRWLLVNGKKQEARTSLIRLRPTKTAREEIEEEMKLIDDAILAEKQMESDIAWSDIWKGTDLVSLSVPVRRMMTFDPPLASHSVVHGMLNLPRLMRSECPSRVYATLLVNHSSA